MSKVRKFSGLELEYGDGDEGATTTAVAEAVFLPDPRLAPLAEALERACVAGVPGRDIEHVLGGAVAQLERRTHVALEWRREAERAEQARHCPWAEAPSDRAPLVGDTVRVLISRAGAWDAAEEEVTHVHKPGDQHSDVDTKQVTRTWLPRGGIRPDRSVRRPGEEMPVNLLGIEIARGKVPAAAWHGRGVARHTPRSAHDRSGRPYRLGQDAENCWVFLNADGEPVFRDLECPEVGATVGVVFRNYHYHDFTTKPRAGAVLDARLLSRPSEQYVAVPALVSAVSDPDSPNSDIIASIVEEEAIIRRRFGTEAGCWTWSCPPA